MSKLVQLKANGKNLMVADVKKKYIENIIKNAALCDDIDKVILFGSTLEERCTDFSDVDIAIFGKYPKNIMLKKKSYNEFVDSVVSFGEIQDYDFLYFDSSKEYTDSIMKDINEGEVLFERM